MAARRKQDSEQKVTLQATPVARTPRRFYMQKMADGIGERAVRVRNSRKGARDQALSDFFGSGTELPSGRNQRSMDSLLGELLSELRIQEDDMAPEMLADAWEKAVGGALAGVSALQSVVRGRARISVSHPTVRYEITRLKPQIIRALNRTLGEGSVKSLVIASA